MAFVLLFGPLAAADVMAGAVPGNGGLFTAADICHSQGDTDTSAAGHECCWWMCAQATLTPPTMPVVRHPAVSFRGVLVPSADTMLRIQPQLTAHRPRGPPPSLSHLHHA
jgi:hypothetical protein